MIDERGARTADLPCRNGKTDALDRSTTTAPFVDFVLSFYETWLIARLQRSVGAFIAQTFCNRQPARLMQGHLIRCEHACQAVQFKLQTDLHILFCHKKFPKQYGIQWLLDQCITCSGLLSEKGWETLYILDLKMAHFLRQHPQLDFFFKKGNNYFRF